jgi:hypothetical protein
MSITKIVIAYRKVPGLSKWLVYCPDTFPHVREGAYRYRGFACADNVVGQIRHINGSFYNKGLGDLFLSGLLLTTMHQTTVVGVFVGISGSNLVKINSSCDGEQIGEINVTGTALQKDTIPQMNIADGVNKTADVNASFRPACSWEGFEFGSLIFAVHVSQDVHRDCG